MAIPGAGAHRVWLTSTDLRLRVRKARVGACILFVVDASGSMAAQRRMAAAKGAVVSLLQAAYQRRDSVGLIAFRGPGAELVLPPTHSVEVGHARLRQLPTGGRTPLASALRLALMVLAGKRTRRDAAMQAPVLVLVSDGRANVPVAGGDPTAEALEAARVLRAAGVTSLVVDAEEGPLRLALARQVCDALGGEYLRLGDVTAGSQVPATPHPLASRALAARDAAFNVRR
jgi:magnesium chelatase subunit D